MQHLHDDGEARQAGEGDCAAVGGNPGLRLGGHEGGVLDTLDEHEVDDGRRGDAAEQTDAPLQVFAVAEGEEQSGEPLHHHAEEEGDGHREEDAHDDREGLFGIEVVGEVHPLGARHLDQRQGEGAAQQLEDHRDGGRGGEAQCVEDIEDDDVGHHHGQKDAEQLLEEELLGTEDAVAGDFHHAVRHEGAAEDARGGNPHDDAIGGHLGADGRREEVHRVVAHADHKVEGGQYEEKQNDSEVDGLHVLRKGLCFACFIGAKMPDVCFRALSPLLQFGCRGDSSPNLNTSVVRLKDAGRTFVATKQFSGNQ